MKTSLPEGQFPVTNALQAEKAERRWALWFAVVFMAVTLLPYIAGYSVQGDDWRFTGFVFGVEDGNSYIAKMLSGATGAWLFRTPYSTVEQQGILAFLPYITLGKLASPPGTHTQLVAIFHFFRMGAGILAILATYDFLALFLPGTKLRRFGLILAAAGGGLGWLLVVLGAGDWLGSLPLDFYSPESFGFLSLFGLPHLALARAGLLWGLVWYLTPQKEMPEIEGMSFWRVVDRRGIKIGLVWLLMGLAQPLTVAIAWIVLAGHLAALGSSNAVRKSNWTSWLRYFRTAAWAGAFTAPLVVYTLFASNVDPFFRMWTEQNKIPSPHPLHYLAAYGLLLPLAVFGAYRLIRAEPEKGALPAAWLVMLPLLAYAPHNLQRRFPDGIWVAIIVLSLYALATIRKPLRRLCRAFSLAFILTIPSTLFIFAGSLLAALQPALPVFRPAEEISIFNSLAAQGQPGDVVLSAYQTGNALPSWAPMRVVIGHGPESIHLEQLRQQVSAVFSSGMGDEARLNFIVEHTIRYLVWGDAERALGGWDPRQESYLKQIAVAGDFYLFEVAPDE